MQWSIDHHVDALISLKSSSTLQREDFNADEMRPEIGVRYRFTPHRRTKVRGHFEFEQQNLYHQELSTWAHSLRTRFRVEGLIPINRKTSFKNRLWDGLTDAEYFGCWRVHWMIVTLISFDSEQGWVKEGELIYMNQINLRQSRPRMPGDFGHFPV